MTKLSVKITGLDRVLEALRRFPGETGRYTQGAGEEAAAEVLDTEGLRQYPPSTYANDPPAPYYIRGQGTQTSDSYNTGSSERLGTQFYVDTRPSSYTTEIGNRSSYGEHVVGEDQASHMGPLGWRRIIDVAEEKLGRITQIYQAWIDKLLRDLGL